VQDSNQGGAAFTNATVHNPSTLVMSSILFGIVGVMSAYKRIKRPALAASPTHSSESSDSASHWR
jgi:hypothetical protein